MCSHVFRGHNSGVATSGSTMASGGSDGQVKMWNLDTGALLSSIVAHGDDVKGIQFIDQSVLSGSLDNICRLYDLRIGQTQRVYEMTSGIYSLQGDTDGRLVIGLGNGTVQYWDMRMDRLVTTFIGHSSWVQALHFESDWLITGSFDGSIVRWDLSYLMRMCSRDINKWAVRSLSFDRSKLITTTWEGVIGVWDPQTLVQHSSWKYNNILYCHHQSDSTMITGSYDATLQVWDFSRGDIQPAVADVD